MDKSGSTLTQKATSGVAWVATLQVSRQLLSIVSLSVVAHKVPATAYGVLSMAAVLTNFFITFRDLGMNSALVRESRLTSQVISTVFWLNCVAGALISSAVFALAVPAAEFYREPALVPVVRALSLYFFISALGTVPGAMLTREMAFNKSTAAQMAGAFSGTAAAVTIAMLGGGVWSLVAANLLTSAVTTIGFWICHPLRIRMVLDFPGVRSIVPYGANLSAFNIVNYFTRNADNLIIGRYLGSAPLGYYQMGYTLMTYPLANFSSLIAEVLFPAMAQVQHDNDRFRSSLVRACTLVSLFTFPVMLGLFVTADPFVRVILGSKWLPVIGLLKVFAPLGMAQSVVTLCGMIYTAKGRTGLMFGWGTFVGVATVTAFFVGLRWGIQGVANCYAITWAVIVIPGLLLVFRLIQLRLRDFLWSLWPTLVASLAMTALAEAWLRGWRFAGGTNSAFLLFSTAAVGAAFYVAVIYRWKPPVVYELRRVVKESSNPAILKLARFLP